ncbi:Protein YcgL [Arsenophonus endosymbiont of Aleurodicus floccissimus]|nr:Protein YcgL [Arsenophonus endosymbiont of Aleurodicus floccissimus]
MNVLCHLLYCKEGTNLSLCRKKDNFSRVPKPLLQQFGTPRFVMTLSLTNRKKLANADIDRVKRELIEVGYYLQFPPPVENIMEDYRYETQAYLYSNW